MANPSTITTVETVSPVDNAYQRKSFYANGRFWVFYSDGTNMVYRTSTDGSTWSSATTVRAATIGSYFSVWFDGTYLHYAYCASSSIYYRRGVPNSNGTITWSAAEQTVSTTYNSANYPFVSVDSNGYVWIGYRDYDGTNYYPYVIKSGNNDGTWGTTPSGFPYRFSTTNSANWKVSVIPLTSGKMLVAYTYNSSTVKIRSWNGSSWNTEVATTSAVYNANYYSIVAQGDDAHLVFLKNTSYDIVYVKYTYSSNSLGSETTLVSAASSSSVPVISINATTNDLYVFAGTKTTGTPSGWTANHIYYIKYTYSSGSWGSWVNWIDESTDTLYSTAKLTCFYKAYGYYIGLIYMTKSTSPYNLRFAFLQLILSFTANEYFKSTESSFVKRVKRLFPHSLKANEILFKRLGVFKRFEYFRPSELRKSVTKFVKRDFLKVNEIIFKKGIIKRILDSLKINELFKKTTKFVKCETFKITDSMKKTMKFVKGDFFKAQYIIRTVGSFKRFLSERLKPNVFLFSKTWQLSQKITEYGERVLTTLTTEVGERVFDTITEFAKIIPPFKITYIFSFTDRFKGNEILFKRIVSFKRTVSHTFKVNELMKKTIKSVKRDFFKVIEVAFLKRVIKRFSDVLKANETLFKRICKFVKYERFKVNDVVGKIVSYKRSLTDRIKQNEMFGKIVSYKRFVSDRFKQNEVFNKILSYKRLLTDRWKINEQFNKIMSYKKFLYDRFKQNEMFQKIVSFKKMVFDRFKTSDVLNKIISYRRVLMDRLKQNELFKKMMIFRKSDFMKANSLLLSKMWQYILRITEYGERVLTTLTTEMGERVFNTVTEFGKIVPMFKLFFSFAEYIRPTYIVNKIVYFKRYFTDVLKQNEIFSKIMSFRKYVMEQIKQNEMFSRITSYKRLFSDKMKQNELFSRITFYKRMFSERFKAIEKSFYTFYKIIVYAFLSFTETFKRFILFKRMFYEFLSIKERTVSLTRKIVSETLKINSLLFSKLVFLVRKLTEYGELVYNNLLSEVGERVFDAVTEFGKIVPKPRISTILFDYLKTSYISSQRFIKKTIEQFKILESMKKVFTKVSVESLKFAHYPLRFVKRLFDMMSFSLATRFSFTRRFTEPMKILGIFYSRLIHFVVWLTEYGEHVFYNIVSSTGKISLGPLTEYGERIINFYRKIVSETLKVNLVFKSFTSYIRRFTENYRIKENLLLFYKKISYIPIAFSETIRTFGSFKRFVLEVFKIESLPSFLFKFKMLTESFKVNFIYFYKRLWSYIFRLTEYGEKVYYDIVTEFGEHSLGKVTEFGKLVPVRLIYRVLGEVASVQENVLTIWHGLRVMYDGFKANIASLFTIFVRVRIVRDFVKASENVWLKVYRRIFLTERFKPTDFIRTFGSFKRFVFENLKVSVVLQKISYTIRPLTDFMKATVSLRTRVSKIIVDNVRVSLNMLSSAARRLYDSFKITDAVRKISFVRRIVFDVTKVSDVIRKNVLLRRIERFKVSETLSSSLYRLYRFIVYDFFRTGDYIGNIIFRYVRTLQEKVQTREKVYFFFYKTIFYTCIKVSDTISKTFKKTVYDRIRFIEYQITRFTRRAYDIFSSREYIFLPIHYLRMFFERLSVSFSLQKTFTKTVYSFMKTTETLRTRFSHLLSDFMFAVEGVSKTVRTLFMETSFSVTDLIWRTVFKLREYLKIAEKFIPFSFREVLKMLIVGSMRTYYSLATNMLSYLRLLMENRQLLSIKENVFQTYVLVGKSVKKAYNILKKILNTLILLLGYKR